MSQPEPTASEKDLRTAERLADYARERLLYCSDVSVPSNVSAVTEKIAASLAAVRAEARRDAFEDAAVCIINQYGGGSVTGMKHAATIRALDRRPA